MTVRTLAVVCLGMAAVAPAARSDDAARQEVEAALRKLNEAFASGNARAIRGLVTDDHTATTTYYGGLADLDEQLRTLPDLKQSEYKAGPMAVRFVAPDTAVISYALKQNGTFRGQPLPPTCAVTAVWVRKGDKWLEAHYQETPTAGEK